MRKFKNFGVELVGYEHGYCNDVLIRDSFAFLSASWDGLRIVDVTNRSKPSATGGINLGNSANHIALLGDIAYIAESTDDFNPKPVGVHIIDTTDKANPIAIQQVVLDYLFLVAKVTLQLGHGMETQASDPRTDGRTPTAGWTAVASRETFAS